MAVDDSGMVCAAGAPPWGRAEEFVTLNSLKIYKKIVAEGKSAIVPDLSARLE
jgi:hypothetical protein